MIGIKQKNQDLFFQTEQTVNRKKSGFRTARYNGARTVVTSQYYYRTLKIQNLSHPLLTLLYLN